MIFVTSNLNFNGGSTFLIRMAKSLCGRSRDVCVISLGDGKDDSIFIELSKYAKIIFVRSLLKKHYKKVPLAHQSMAFLPVDRVKLSEVLSHYGKSVHALGAFSLIFCFLIKKNCDHQLSISVGIYHQNEFLFTGGGPFARLVKKVFTSLRPDQVIFFSEFNQSRYSSFFKKDYFESPLFPVGIEIPKLVNIRQPNKHKIVSIGNLYPFKTYNLHVIKALPKLLEFDNDVVYEVYGEGPLQVDMELLAEELGVRDHLKIMGRCDYENLPTILNNAFLFVGSGTAIVEASSYGVPSIIGIESSEEAVTYGFLSETKGYSFNQSGIDYANLYFLEDKILEVFLDCEAWFNQARACRKRAEDFSINITSSGFLKHNESILNKISCIEEGRKLKLTGISVLTFVLLEFFLQKITNSNKSFAKRRNQGSL